MKKMNDKPETNKFEYIIMFSHSFVHVEIEFDTAIGIFHLFLCNEKIGIKCSV